MKRITGLTGEGMQFSSFLKARKDMAAWTDAEILAAMPEWRTSREAEVKETKSKATKETAAAKEEEPATDGKAKAAKVKKASAAANEEEPAAKIKAPKAAKVKEAPAPAPAPAPPAPVVAEETPVSGSNASEFHLNEAKKKVVTATNIAEKAEIEAKRATERAEEAMKVAMDLKVKATVATTVAAEARAVVGECQKDVIAKTAEFEKAAAASAAAASAPAATTEPDSPSEPLHLRRKKIPKHIKTLVWNKYIGADIAQADCISCRQVKITNRSFHCGHVIAESKGGDMTINNLRPICEACNGSMGTQSMNEFTKAFFDWTV